MGCERTGERAASDGSDLDHAIASALYMIVYNAKRAKRYHCYA